MDSIIKFDALLHKLDALLHKLDLLLMHELRSREIDIDDMDSSSDTPCNVSFIDFNAVHQTMVNEQRKRTEELLDYVRKQKKGRRKPIPTTEKDK